MSKMTDLLGARGEDAALHYLQAQGLELLDRNWRAGSLGEIDLVMEDGGQIVFVEVKTRSGGPDEVREVISPDKLRRLRNLVTTWLDQADRYWHYRLDLVGVSPAGEQATISWWKGIDQ